MNNLEKIKELLPDLHNYLKAIETISDEFPICCQESSLILYVWLKKQGVDCKIVANYYDDPIKGHKTIHFFVETEETIVDGSAVQFKLKEYKKRTYKEIEPLINETRFVYEKSNQNYINKVDAYINGWMHNFLEALIENVQDDFDEFISEIKRQFDDNKKLVNAMERMIYTSLCKIYVVHYNATYEDFVNDCKKNGMGDKIPYIDKNHVMKLYK